MVLSTMGGRWATNEIKYSYFPLLILVLAHGCSSLNPEGLALLDFKARVSHDPYGAFASWNVDDNDPCSWSYVQCVFGNVHTLDLKGLSLEGVLTPELGNLTHLRRLVLSHNHFHGVIPKEIGKLNMLEVLDLRDNKLIGNIPPEVETMQSLKYLLLHNNNLEGSIPHEFESLNLLYKLQFDDNLTFSVTDAIGFLNRKLGRCIWQGGFNHLRNADSVISPFKETVINCLKPFQLFSKGISDNSCVNEESPLTPKIVENTKIDGCITSRKLIEEPTNVASESSYNDDDMSARGGIIGVVPSTKSSGCFWKITKRFDDTPSSSSETSDDDEESTESQTNSDMWKILIGMCCGSFLLITSMTLSFMCHNKAVKTMGPWRPGLSRQLQKAFVTGVQKLDHSELETACEDFSNIIETMEGCTLYKGTLSSGVEICVASTTITRLKDWSKHAQLLFHNKIEMLSRVNHKNFVNLIGYCEEDKPFVRMMVFEYAPSGSLSEHLHVQEVEHLDWSARMRIILGVAYCLQCMHDLSPPVVHMDLNSKMIYLTDDNAAKVADLSFWKEFSQKEKISGANKSKCVVTPDKESNIYSFGVLLLEIISGKHPYSDKQEPLVTWVEEFLKDNKNISHMIDPTLKSFKQKELDVVCEVIQECIEKDGSEKPTINKIIRKLRDESGISPEQAIPRLSPLWWAELEILSEDET
ncbi:protein MALE DISCOVERER 2 [Lactuca sativa]|uniref:Protein kinase domain-containing protein n=1 Tax=Lactuca sativa TaxID=4236 RepID=A0A9R1VV59_LACSA|nr:protein MALE DISCOVERER 2 [Lactuca sativa]KAJ0212503.1 hypothetical protein LSAT_V11C400176250 [Lactuca sativa]